MLKKLLIINLILMFSNMSIAGCNTHIIPDAPNNRYQLLNFDEVKDIKTNLIWKRCSLGQTWNGSDSCTGSKTTHTWRQALQIAALNGWRVPNIKELRSLVEFSCESPSINSIYFPNTGREAYWSSSTVVDTPETAWIILFGSGSKGYYHKDIPLFVRLVRSPQ